MEQVFSFIYLLKAPLILYFKCYKDVLMEINPDKTVAFYNVLQEIKIDTSIYKNTDAYCQQLEELIKKATAYLQEFYYNKIESPTVLIKLHNDLSLQLNEIQKNYKDFEADDGVVKYSDRIVLQLAYDSERSEEVGDFYYNLSGEELTFAKHFQIITTLKSIIEKENKHLSKFAIMIEKLNINTIQQNPADFLPTPILEKIYAKFSPFLNYTNNAEFIDDVRSRNKLKLKKGFHGYLVYLFHAIFKKRRIKGRSYILKDLFNLSNRSKDDLKTKPILNEIETFLLELDD